MAGQEHHTGTLFLLPHILKLTRKYSRNFPQNKQERVFSMNTMNGCSGNGSPGRNMGNCRGGRNNCGDNMTCSTNAGRKGHTGCNSNRNRQGNANCDCNMRRQGNTNCSCNNDMGRQGNTNCDCSNDMPQQSNTNCGCSNDMTRQGNTDRSCNRDRQSNTDCQNRCRQNNCGMNGAEMEQMMRNCQYDPANSCNGDPLYGMPLAIGYVPWQRWCKTYEPHEGLANGTIFPELNLQFYGCIPQNFVCKKGGRV